MFCIGYLTCLKHLSLKVTFLIPQQLPLAMDEAIVPLTVYVDSVGADACKLSLLLFLKKTGESGMLDEASFVAGLI